MVKALLKKQLLEIFAWVYRNQKTGKRRNRAGIIGFSALYIFLFAYLGVMFYFLADVLCTPLVIAGFGWLYIALTAIVSITLCVFGSVFSTHTTLYQGKDNDLLLSMPVTVSKILFVRLAGVYIMGFLYSLPVMIPSMIVYFRSVSLQPIALLLCLMLPVVLSFFVLSLSCILGWVVAVVSSRLRNRKIISVILCLGFLGGYYYLTGNMNTILSGLLANPENLGNQIKGIVYPLYHMGRAAEGNVLSFLLFTGMVFAFFGMICFVLHKSFLKLATTNRGMKKVKYTHKKNHTRPVSAALLSREFRRFFGSVNYMLNCGLGIVFMIAVGIYALVEQSFLSVLGILFHNEGVLALLVCGAVCMMASMNDLTAPSVSLEGKTIWLAQVLPITSWQVLRAKLSMQLILTLIPAYVLSICVIISLKLSVFYAIFIFAISSLFVAFIGMLGLALNLKMPNLSWTNENVPIKQSAPVMLTLFGGWVIVLLLGGLYYLLRYAVVPIVYMLLVGILLAAAAILLLRWLKNTGSKIFATLSC